MAMKHKDKIHKYPVIFEAASEGGYTVYAPTLPGCVSEGDTFEEAKKNITEAIGLYLESLAKDGITSGPSADSVLVGAVDVVAPRALPA